MLARLGVRPPYIVFVGTLEPRKAVPDLVAAFDRMADGHPDLSLVLVGGSGWGLADIERSIAAARHADRVVRTGYVPDRAVPALLRRAAVAAYPSIEEGFGLPALEALACGTPARDDDGDGHGRGQRGRRAPGRPRRRGRPGRGPRGPARRGAGGGGAPASGARGGRPATPGSACAERHMDAYRWAARARRRSGRRRPGWPAAATSKVRRVRALVTGAKGFVGPWLTAHLRDEGDEVIGIDREVDITDAAAVREAVMAAGPDAIYHLAARAHVGESWAEPEDVLQVNAVGTLHLLEAARACATVPRVLLISSAEVYGAVDEDQLPVTEETPLAPVTPYAASKVAAEYLGVQAHLAHGLPVVRVRPFNHVGPGQSPGFVVAGPGRPDRRSGPGRYARPSRWATSRPDGTSPMSATSSGPTGC